jgi:hypothetical protein
MVPGADRPPPVVMCAEWHLRHRVDSGCYVRRGCGLESRVHKMHRVVSDGGGGGGGGGLNLS